MTASSLFNLKQTTHWTAHTRGRASIAPDHFYRPARHCKSLQRRGRQGSLCCRAEDTGRDGPSERDIQQLLQTVGHEPRIGSEYGEGFVQYKIRGEPGRLDVDTLNEQLRAWGAQRMRQFMRPDEAMGAIVCWDGIITDMRILQRKAWQRVASDEGLPFPRTPAEQHVFELRPERAITEVLGWTSDPGKAQRLAWLVASSLAGELKALTSPAPGVREWLGALATAHIPCALVTSLDRISAGEALDHMGLSRSFRARVTADDGMDTRAQHLLSAAIQLHRPPNRCVVFDATPAGITAAHNCTMKAVAVLGTHPAWKLHAADLTCSNFDELTVYNLRRLFANSGNEFMDVCEQRHAPPGRRVRWATTGTVDP